MKTTVEIADPLMNQVKSIAAKERISFRVLVEEGLRAVVERRMVSAHQPFRLRDGSFRGGEGLRPGVELKDLTALAYEAEGESVLR
ncbi:MAG: hypothetical protein JNL98_08145 [Bryobacterales bacterium]|nr:hypothetical protein [Bryobacterales bacterium]